MYEPLLANTSEVAHKLIDVEYGLEGNPDAIQATYAVTTDEVAWVTVDGDGAHPAFGGTGMAGEIQPYIEHARDLYTFYQTDGTFPHRSTDAGERGAGDDVPFTQQQSVETAMNERYRRELQSGPGSGSTIGFLLGHWLNPHSGEAEALYLHYNERLTSPEETSTRARTGTIVVGQRQHPIVDAFFAQMLAQSRHVFALNTSRSTHQLLPRCSDHHRIGRYSDAERFSQLVQRNCQSDFPTCPPVGAYIYTDSVAEGSPLRRTGNRQLINQNALTVLAVEQNGRAMTFGEVYDHVMQSDHLDPMMVIGCDNADGRHGALFDVRRENARVFFEGLSTDRPHESRGVRTLAGPTDSLAELVQ